MSDALLRTGRAGAVARVTLARPEVRNAFNDDADCRIDCDAFRSLGMPTTRCAWVVLAGRRPGILCRRRPELDAPHGRLLARGEPRRRCRASREMLRTIAHCRKPTIARVQGDA